MKLLNGGVIIISDHFKNILKNYIDAKNQNFIGNPIAEELRNSLPNEIKTILKNDFIVKGSPGQGNWARLPWVGIFDPEITTTAQSGYYIVYLFKENMQGVYLSLNQGVTNIRNTNGDKKAIEYLIESSKKFRTQLNIDFSNESELIKSIELGDGNFAPFYEAGNIYAKYYPLDAFPSEDIFIDDLNEFIGFYDKMKSHSENKELIVVEDEEEIKKVQELFLNSILKLTDEQFTVRVGFPGGQEDAEETYWSNELGMWMQPIEIEHSRYWHGFGLEKPNPEKSSNIICEINFPIKDINRRVAGVIAKDQQNNYYILHRGKLGGNFSKRFFEENYEGEWTVVQDGDRETEMVIIGKLEDPKFPYNVRDFVREIYKMKYDDQIPKEETEVIQGRGINLAFYDHLIEKGYYFDKETIENYLLSLKVKPFVILTGNSGTGKTKLAQLFAQYLTKDTNEKLVTTEVKVGKSAKSGGWTLNRNDMNDIIKKDDYGKTYPIKVDGISLTGKFNVLPRIFYNDNNNQLISRLEELAKENPNQKVKLEIELPKSDSRQYKIIPVGANWTENRQIVGFHNVITGNYQKTPALELILDAFKPQNHDIPHFLILDEMNLSHVERYFADFLSALESGEKIPLHKSKDLEDNNKEIPEELKLYSNLLVIGTVNVDETTYMFSPKVLDRANTIEFKTYSAQDYMLGEFNDNAPRGDLEYLENPLSDLEIRNSNIKDLREILEGIESPDGDNIWVLLSNELESFQKTLKKAGFDFGFRVINEILRFMCVAWKYENEPEEWSNWERYFDAQIKQKMLPKIHGSERVLGEVLNELLDLCKDSSNNVKFITSSKKLEEMIKVLYEQRYVSFIN